MKNAHFLQGLLLTLCIGLCLILAISVIVLMGAEYDEAWIVTSHRQAFDASAVAQVRPVATTGGLTFFLVGLTHGVPVSPLLIPRILSFLALLGLMLSILWAFGPHFRSGVERKIMLATCLAAPGTILIAGMGYGAVTATALFLTGLFVALRETRIPVMAALLGGVLIGLAIATRWTFLPAMPALLLWLCYSRGHLGWNLAMVVLAGLVAVGVFAGSLSLQLSLLDGTGPAAAGVSLTTNLSSAGVGRGLPPLQRMFSFVVRFLTTLPVALLVLAFTAWFAWREDAPIRRLVVVLIGASVLVTGAWMVSSPWMHLRYIWPVYMMLAVCAGFGLVALYRLAEEVKRPELSFAIVGLPVALILVQLAVAVRTIAIGAAMQINAAGLENIENHFRPFRHIQEEQEIVRILGSLPPGTVVGTIGLPPEYGALELSLLSDRPVYDYTIPRDIPQTADGTIPAPGYFVTHRFSALNDAGQAWVETLGEPAYEAYGYRIYAMPDGVALPEPEEVLIDPQLYRFTLERIASLTWF